MMDSAKNILQRYNVNRFNNDNVDNVIDADTFVPKNAFEEVALKWAKRLDDKKSLRKFIKLSYQLRNPALFTEIAEKVAAVPKDKIKKTRGAYFTFLIKLELEKMEAYN